MEQSPSWEANWSAASQEIPRIFIKTKGSSSHSQAHATCPYPELAPSSPHTPTSHFPKIHRNIILPSTPGSPQWSPSLRFPHQNPVHTSPLPHTRYMPRPFFYLFFYIMSKEATNLKKKYWTQNVYFDLLYRLCLEHFSF